jgi:hypothetical protein
MKIHFLLLALVAFVALSQHNVDARLHDPAIRRMTEHRLLDELFQRRMEGHDRRTARRLRAFDPYLDVDVVEGPNGLLWGESGSMLLARPGYGYLVNRQIQKRDEYKYCTRNIDYRNSPELLKCMKTQGWYFSYRSGRWHTSEERRREDDKRYASKHKESIWYAPRV